MAQAQHTPLAKFDDIPGQLPQSQVPDDVDLSAIAKDAVSKVNNLQPDDLAEYAVWRDLLTFTGTYRTFYSGQKVFHTFQRLRQQKHSSEFQLKDTPPRKASCLADSWVDIDVTFTTDEDGLLGEGAGTVSLALDEDGKWRIWMLRTWLENFEGHGHPDMPKPGLKATNGVNGHTNGITNGTNGSHADTYDVVIVGGGQSGLSTAGRLQALGLKYILLEKRPEIGHVWAARYDSLRWHTSKWYGSLPFEHTYSEEEDYMVPAKRIGASHKDWAERYGLNYRTNMSVDGAKYDEGSETWTVSATSPEGKVEFNAKNLVLSIGTGHLTPSLPSWATPDKIAASGYKGTIMHSTNYTSSTAWAGKRGLVVGTANTGHDVAEDMANAGMSTTMLQRGHTFVFPAPWLHHAEDLEYNAHTPVSEADRTSFTYPNKVMREMVNRIVHFLIKKDPEQFDALEKAGFKLDRYGDIYSHLYIHFGGHYVDIGASKRISEGEIKVVSKTVKKLTESGVEFEDGYSTEADLIVLCTGFNHDFRADAKRLLGEAVADKMDDFWGVDGEGEIRGHAKIAGRKLFSLSLSHISLHL
jgi:cation diffusion facilitator CzcD-associated flavoprotein CzcO